MKKSALMSAIALTSAFGLASCSSTEDDGNMNPTFDGQSVKTQFAINIPRAAGNNGTRATAAQTQGETNSPFLGMEGIVLRPIVNNALQTNISLTSIANNASTVKIYDDVTVPVNTNKFLFYGFATPSTDASNNSFIKGEIENGTSGSPATASSTSDISFKLKKIQESISATDDNQANKILAVLNKVKDVDGFSTAGANTFVGDLYTQFIQLKAGSATSVQAALQALLKEIAKNAGSTEESSTEATLLANMKTAITEGNYFSISDDNTITCSETNPFPRNLNLPDGIAKLKIDNNKFTYDFTSSTLSKDDGTGMTINPTTITYPARLSYFAETEVKTYDSNPTWPTTSTDWASYQWTGWGSSVTSNTYAIALKDNIQYGVASFMIKVKGADGLKGSYDGKDVSVPTNGFKITGLLIGGQPTSVGYNFQPTGSDYSLSVYDKISQDLTVKAGETSSANYTIVLPSQEVTNTTGSVQIALELENGNNQFQGADGVIPAKSKFYLLGTLDPNAYTDVTQPTGENGTKRVFMSDYQTTATLTISTLNNAYNVIPDIRSEEKKLGLSVDLEWQKGYQFDITIGNN